MDRVLVVDGHRSMYCTIHRYLVCGTARKMETHNVRLMTGWVGEVDANEAFAQLQSPCVRFIPVSSHL